MGTTNYGNQQITFAYGMRGRSQYFNRINYLIAPQGIYSGGTLTKENTNLISISPFVAFVTAYNEELSVKIETKDTVYLNVSNAESFIIVRYTWLNKEGNFADILAIERSDILETDLMLGRCIYDAGVLSTTFDLSERESSVLQDAEDEYSRLRVTQTDTPSNRVYISAGKIRTYNQIIDFAGGYSPYFEYESDTVNGYKDAVYLDENGLIQILSNVDTSVTDDDYRTKLILAEIDRNIDGILQDTITGNMITNTNFKFYPLEFFTEAEGSYAIAVADENDYIGSDSVGDALNDVLNRTFVNADLEEIVSQYDPIGITNIDNNGNIKYGKALSNFVTNEYEINTNIDNSATMSRDFTHTILKTGFYDSGNYIAVVYRDETSKKPYIDIIELNRSTYAIQHHIQAYELLTDAVDFISISYYYDEESLYKFAISYVKTTDSDKLPYIRFGIFNNINNTISLEGTEELIYNGYCKDMALGFNHFSVDTTELNPSTYDTQEVYSIISMGSYDINYLKKHNYGT